MHKIETQMKSPFGEFSLQRYPLLKKQTLRAWDAADEYLLKHLSDNTLASAGRSLLIVNDGFGGLAIPLHTLQPVVMTDSYLSTQAVLNNMQHNDIAGDTVRIIDSLEAPSGYFAGAADIVAIKLPKSLAMLEDQLYRIRPVLSPSTIIIAAGMTKHVHRSVMALFQKTLGPTKTSLARKKARLIFCESGQRAEGSVNPYPKSYDLPYRLDDRAIAVSNHAAVFSQEKLDMGSRFFIENLPHSEAYKTIIDLGCGNGALGLMAAIKNPQAKLIFTDESYMAVDSAITNFVAVFGDSRDAEFLQTDCLQGVQEDSVSLVLCNPPFHQNNAVSDATAWQMFSESRSLLADKGELWVIGNRHLAYHVKLKRLFGNCEVVASNSRFVIYKALSVR